MFKKTKLFVKATADSGGGSAPVIDELNVTPTISAQTINPGTGVDGFAPVKVAAVDATIDANITAANIVSGTTILGVAGSAIELNGETVSVTPTTSAQTITPTAPKNGITEISVAAVTAAIDANIAAGNIKDGVTILGVQGTYTGTTPTGTKSITTNGVYDVTDFASADVQVPTTAPAHYIERDVDANGKLIGGTNIINLNGVTDIGNYALAYSYYNNTNITGTVDMSDLTAVSGNGGCNGMFSGCTGLTGVDLSSLTTLSGSSACQNMFYNCSGLTSVDLSSLTTVSSQSACYYMLYGCTGLTSIDLSGLTTISGTNGCYGMLYGCNRLTTVDLSGLITISGSNGCYYMFYNCTGLTSVDLSSLTTISGSSACQDMFNGCTGLTTAKFNALNTMTVQISPSYGQMFSGCTHLESVELGGLIASTFASKKDQIRYLFNNTTGSQALNGCTVHFPSNFDPSDPDHTFDASTLTGYPTFGGSASYIHVAFDLPATE